jgi:hypothetical protein
MEEGNGVADRNITKNGNIIYTYHNMTKKR